jgi:hypothetical protein
MPLLKVAIDPPEGSTAGNIGLGQNKNLSYVYHVRNNG